MGDATQVFGTYASYYDELYQDKDYEAEVDFVERMLGEHAPGKVKSILDLGCGTGGHALPLIRRGYAVTGVDRSQGMLDRARAKAEAAGVDLPLHQGDVRDLDLGATFDAAIFMFAVVAYQPTNADLTGALRTARRHLEPGGLGFFDTWYGPAVLADPPTDRIKEMTHPADGTRIIRITQPVHDQLRQTIEVRFHVLHLKGEEVLQEVRESHLMRYLFPQELSFHLEQAGFKLVKLCPFMDADAEMSDAYWNMAVVAEAI
ncbi:MAG: methyltransferase domain-containing protein [Anaerolineae bacterium]|nr:MAG: methyltransferase domain-containing protein [Anaerolineae bacterium]